MTGKPWHGSRWPKGVPFEITGFEKPVFSILDNSARKYPDSTFTIFNGRTRTYSQARDTANRVANFLLSKGLKRGDRVAIFLPNLPFYPEIFFGILKAGGVCVTCNPLYKPSELNFQLKDSGAKTVFVMDHPGFYRITLEAMQGTEVDTVVICNIKSYLPTLKGVLGSLLGKIPKAGHHDPGHFMFDDVINAASPDLSNPEIDPIEDNALILYTGGTTGIPKGACLTHANLMSNVMSSDELTLLSEKPGGPLKKLRRGGSHTFLGVLPWYHSFGLTACMLCCCNTASRLVCIPDPRAGKPPFTDVLKSIARYNITIVVAVPTIYSAFINHPMANRFDLSSIIACVSGAAPLPGEVIRKFEEMTGSVIFEGYGLTETSPVISCNPSDVSLRKIGSVGLPFPSVDIKVVDTENGVNELPPGSDGEIAANGPQVMKGYWNKPDADKEVFRAIDGNRYFLTGDIGHIDKDGFVFITDRKKDLILVSGFNAYPADIEETLYTNPKVAMAAVIGVPDNKSGEAVKAFIQLKPGEEATEQEIIDFCRARMAGYKRPKYIEFRANLPTSIVGKVLRRVLREEELKKQQASNFLP